MSSHKAVIFDLDGTLIDSIPAYFNVFKTLIKKFGINCKEKDFIDINGMSIESGLKKLIKEKNLKKRILIYLFFNKKRIQKKINSEIKIFPDTKECLEKLAGFSKAIATSASREYLNYNLKRFNLSHYFQTTVTKDDIKYVKPSPDIFVLMSKKLGLAADRCVVVEDSPVGVVAAKGAGMKCIVVLNKNSKQFFPCEAEPDVFIENLSELTTELIKLT